MWFLALHLLEIPGTPRCGRRRSGVRDQRSRVTLADAQRQAAGIGALTSGGAPGGRTKVA